MTCFSNHLYSTCFPRFDAPADMSIKRFAQNLFIKTLTTDSSGHKVCQSWCAVVDDDNMSTVSQILTVIAHYELTKPTLTRLQSTIQSGSDRVRILRVLMSALGSKDFLIAIHPIFMISTYPRIHTGSCSVISPGQKF